MWSHRLRLRPLPSLTRSSTGHASYYLVILIFIICKMGKSIILPSGVIMKIKIANM